MFWFHEMRGTQNKTVTTYKKFFRQTIPVFSHKLEHELSSCLASSKLARIYNNNNNTKFSFCCNIHTFIFFMFAPCINDN